MAEKGFPVDVALPAVIVPGLVIAMFALRIGQGLIVWVYIAYLIIFMRHLAKTGGQKIKIKSLSISTACAITIWIVYTELVGGWFWNDDWVIQEVLTLSVIPPIVLILLNIGSKNLYGQQLTHEQSQQKTMKTVGYVASLPFCLNPLAAVPALIALIVFSLMWHNNMNYQAYT